jgi:hypothetical protein
MATVKCKEPGCPCEINTKLYCQDLISWLRLSAFLEKEKTRYAPDSSQFKNISEHLNLVSLQLKAFKLKEEKAMLEAAGATESDHPAPLLPKLKELYLTCAKGHSYYYEVDCSL